MPKYVGAPWSRAGFLCSLFIWRDRSPRFSSPSNAGPRFPSHWKIELSSIQLSTYKLFPQNCSWCNQSYTSSPLGLLAFLRKPDLFTRSSRFFVEFFDCGRKIQRIFWIIVTRSVWKCLTSIFKCLKFPLNQNSGWSRIDWTWKWNRITNFWF